MTSELSSRQADKAKMLSVAKTIRAIQLPEMSTEEGSMAMGELNLKLMRCAQFSESEADGAIPSF